MQLGWKVLMPINLVWILILAGLRLWAHNTNNTEWLTLAGIVVTVLLLMLIWPERQKPAPAGAERTVDTGLGGYPVPPLDLTVPPTPRLKRLEADRTEESTVTAASGSGAGSAASGGKEE
jgi:NADH-quinone oxidoreductase subunit H